MADRRGMPERRAADRTWQAEPAPEPASWGFDDQPAPPRQTRRAPEPGRSGPTSRGFDDQPAPRQTRRAPEPGWSGDSTWTPAPADPRYARQAGAGPDARTAPDSRQPQRAGRPMTEPSRRPDLPRFAPGSRFHRPDPAEATPEPPAPPRSGRSRAERRAAAAPEPSRTERRAPESGRTGQWASDGPEPTRADHGTTEGRAGRRARRADQSGELPAVPRQRGADATPLWDAGTGSAPAWATGGVRTTPPPASGPRHGAPDAGRPRHGAADPEPSWSAGTGTTPSWSAGTGTAPSRETGTAPSWDTGTGTDTSREARHGKETAPAWTTDTYHGTRHETETRTVDAAPAWASDTYHGTRFETEAVEGPESSERSAADIRNAAPLMGQIFPNHPSTVDTPEDGEEPPRQRTSHRRQSALARWARNSGGQPTLDDEDLLGTETSPVSPGMVGSGGAAKSQVTGSRRRILLGLGTSAVAASAVPGVVSLVTEALTDEPGQGTVAAKAKGPMDLGATGIAGTPAEAARLAGAAKPNHPTPLARDAELHLLRRATFGPTLLDMVAIKQMGVDAWIERQLNPVAIPDPVDARINTDYPLATRTIAQLRAQVKEEDYNKPMAELGQATMARQMWSSRQLYEVMVDFWSNHLNVTNPFDGGWDNRVPYDREVIRKFALGKFSDMLYASARHPAMMRYLDNASSTRRSVNENYGRELLELHTVGVEAKYTEADVRHSAYIMSGRTVDDRTGMFKYEARRHKTGAVKVLGFKAENKSANDGLKLGDQYLAYLAVHPATAQRIARKLAIRFVCDEPPRALTDRLAKAYLDNKTDIKPVLRTLFQSLEFWISQGLKSRRPLEHIVATARVLGVEPGTNNRDAVESLYYLASDMGHAPLGWVPPDGYPDVQDSWNSAHAMLGSWNIHRALSQGKHKGITYVKPDQLVGANPGTVGKYLDVLAQRLLFQPLRPEDKKAMLTFLNFKDNTKVTNNTLGGKVQHLVPLYLDSVYHALR